MSQRWLISLESVIFQNFTVFLGQSHFLRYDFLPTLRPVLILFCTVDLFQRSHFECCLFSSYTWKCPSRLSMRQQTRLHSLLGASPYIPLESWVFTQMLPPFTGAFPEILLSSGCHAHRNLLCTQLCLVLKGRKPQFPYWWACSNEYAEAPSHVKGGDTETLLNDPWMSPVTFFLGWDIFKCVLQSLFIYFVSCDPFPLPCLLATFCFKSPWACLLLVVVVLCIFINFSKTHKFRQEHILFCPHVTHVNSA